MGEEHHCNSYVCDQQLTNLSSDMIGLQQVLKASDSTQGNSFFTSSTESNNFFQLDAIGESFPQMDQSISLQETNAQYDVSSLGQNSDFPQTTIPIHSTELSQECLESCSQQSSLFNVIGSSPFTSLNSDQVSNQTIDSTNRSTTSIIGPDQGSRIPIDETHMPQFETEKHFNDFQNQKQPVKPTLPSFDRAFPCRNSYKSTVSQISSELVVEKQPVTHSQAIRAKDVLQTHSSTSFLCHSNSVLNHSCSIEQISDASTRLISELESLHSEMSTTYQRRAPVGRGGRVGISPKLREAEALMYGLERQNYALKNSVRILLQKISYFSAVLGFTAHIRINK